MRPGIYTSASSSSFLPQLASERSLTLDIWCSLLWYVEIDKFGNLRIAVRIVTVKSKWAQL